MKLDLTDEEAAALLSLLNRVIDDDRYPLSPRIRICATSGQSSRAPRVNRWRPDRPHRKSATRGERRAVAIDDEGDGMQILWSLTAIASLLAIVFIITQG
jgi:hypothetical protein